MNATWELDDHEVKAIFWELLRLANVTISECGPPQFSKLEIRRRHPAAYTEHAVVVSVDAPSGASLREAVQLGCSRIAKGLLGVLTKPDAQGPQLLSAKEARRLTQGILHLSEKERNALTAMIDRVTVKEDTW